MNEPNIGGLLKDLRKKAGFTLKEASAKIKEKGFTVSFQTIGGYEKGRSTPNADLFLALCELYGSHNPILELNKLEANESLDNFEISAKEEEHLEKYRVLDSHGKRAVDAILELEAERLLEAKRSKKKQPSKIGAEFDTETLIAASGAENLNEKGKTKFEGDIERAKKFIADMGDQND